MNLDVQNVIDAHQLGIITARQFCDTMSEIINRDNREDMVSYLEKMGIDSSLLETEND